MTQDMGAVRLARIDRIITEIRVAQGGPEPLPSWRDEMEREQRRQDIATSAKIMGIPVKSQFRE